MSRPASARGGLCSSSAPGFLALIVTLAVEPVLAAAVLALGERTTNIGLEVLSEIGHAKGAA